MMSRVIESLKNGLDEGVHVINSSIDDMVYVDPEEQADTQAYADAEAEIEKEQSRVDKINAKVDDKVENVHEKVDKINQTFDHGAQKVKDVSQSQFMQAYRAMRMVYWGNLAAGYMKSHPEWMNDLKEFGKSAAAKLQESGIADATDDMTDTEQICARRDAMFGSPDAGVAVDTTPTTEMILNGADVSTMGLESLALEAAI